LAELFSKGWLVLAQLFSKGWLDLVQPFLKVGFGSTFFKGCIYEHHSLVFI
jgi:hypothetical protein